MSTTPGQLGDATVLRCSGSGFFGVGETTVLIHQASDGFMKIGVREDDATSTARLKTADLPELSQTLIARSGRTDLFLHHHEPSSVKGMNVKVEASADADAAVQRLKDGAE